MYNKEFFDPALPAVREIREKYGRRLIDLNQYECLTHRDVADAILRAGRRGEALCIPPGSRYRIWDRGSIFRRKGKSIRLNTALRFKKYGPEIDLTKSGTGVKEIKERELTPRKAFREKLGDPGVRKALLEGSYRGVGWWDPKKRTHRITPFDVFAEGHKFNDFYGKDMVVEFQYADCRVTVPSLSREGRDYIIEVRVLPVTEENDDCLVEWLMTEATCGCEDRFFRGAKSKLREDDEAKCFFKYANPEHTHCRHFWGVLEKVTERSYRDPKTLPLLVEFPKVTGLLSPWHALKTRTLIGNEKAARRPLKAEIGILCGKVIGYEGPESMFDLSDDE